MTLKIPFTYILIAFFVMLGGCEQENPVKKPAVKQTQEDRADQTPTGDIQSQATDQSEAGILLKEPLQLQRFESVVEALPIWREHSDQKPAMVLLSGAPPLVRTPAGIIEHVDHLALHGNRRTLFNASRQSNPQALFNPAMTLDIALRNQWFSQLRWVIPMQDQVIAPDFEGIRNQLFERNMVTEKEAATFLASGKTMRGTLRNTPLSVSNMSALELPDGPVIVHIDLGYLQGLYMNEIATPLMQTVYSTLSALKERKVNVLAVTFSYGHIDNQIALDVRFLGEVLDTLISDPSMLGQKPPTNWKRQADAIYLLNFFQAGKVDELYKAQEKNDPDSAWVKFSLYRSSASLNQGEDALDYLAQAVELDPMYAYEYGNLARMAYERNRPDETMRMYSLASKALPDDHLIKLSMAELAAEMGDHKTAKHLAEELKELPWSPPYHGEMHNYLENFINSLEAEESSSPVKQ